MKNAPAIAAEQLVKQYHTSNPFRLCEEMEIQVAYHKLIDMRGFYMQWRGCSVIIIANDLPDHVRAFVCAHELGHVVLHKKLNRLFMDTHTYMETNRYENEADKFACTLLYSKFSATPENSLTDREFSECLNVSPEKLSTKFVELGFLH